MKDSDGNKTFVMISGKLILGLADAIKGVNQRIHGNQNPEGETIQ